MKKPSRSPVGAFLCPNLSPPIFKMTLVQTLSLDEILVGSTPLQRFACLEPSPGRAYSPSSNGCNSAAASRRVRPWRSFVMRWLPEPGGRYAVGRCHLGQHGIAYAQCCHQAGLPLTLFLPANASEERKATLRRLGVELVLTDAMEGTDGVASRFRARSTGP